MGVSVLVLNYSIPILFYSLKIGKTAQGITSTDFLIKIKKVIKKLEDFF